MHFRTLILCFLALTFTDALPFANIIASYRCNNTCINTNLLLLPPATRFTPAQLASITFIIPTASFNPIPGLAQALSRFFSFPTARTHSTIRYTNTGVPVSLFARAREIRKPAAVAHEEPHSTVGGARFQPSDGHELISIASAPRTIHPRAIPFEKSGTGVNNGLKVAPSEELEFAAFDSIRTTVIPQNVLLKNSKSSGDVVGNGVEGGGDLIEVRALDGDNENKTELGRLLAKEAGGVGSGNTIPPMLVIKRSTFIGNGIKADNDITKKRAFDGETNNDIKSGQLLAE